MNFILKAILIISAFLYFTGCVGSPIEQESGKGAGLTECNVCHTSPSSKCAYNNKANNIVSKVIVDPADSDDRYCLFCHSNSINAKPVKTEKFLYKWGTTYSLTDDSVTYYVDETFTHGENRWSTVTGDHANSKVDYSPSSLQPFRCDICHQDSLISTGSHRVHITNGTNCYKCHYNTYDTTGTTAPGYRTAFFIYSKNGRNDTIPMLTEKHNDGNIDFEEWNEPNFYWDDTNKTCATSCHGLGDTLTW